MELMRKLRDEGKFKNSMLAEIERDRMMAKMKEQVDEIQADLEVRISPNKTMKIFLLYKEIFDVLEEAECQGLPLDTIKQEIRDDWMDSGRLDDYL